jgi:hypothetical protein
LLIGAGGSLILLDEPVPGDYHLRCHVTAVSATKWGITLRDSAGEGAEQGIAFQADLEHGEWQFGTPVHRWCSRIDPVEVIRTPPQRGQRYQVDLLLRDIYFEAYVDGIWLFTRVIPHCAREGRLGFFVHEGEARFEAIEAWQLEPMTNTYAAFVQ